MDKTIHDEAMAIGQIRYCPVCDGYEVTDKAVAVIGNAERGPGEAIFLRGYTADLTLIGSDGPLSLDDEDRAQLDAAGIVLLDGPVDVIEPGEKAISVTLCDGKRLEFASIYPALGSDVRNQLAAMAGAKLAENGCALVDDHMRTSVAGLYAAGDLVLGLDQISNAMGQGGVASTTIRNDLAKQRPLFR